MKHCTKNLASPQTSVGVRLSRIRFSPTDRGGEMNAWQTNPNGRLRGGYQKFPWKSYSTTHLPFLLSNFKILNLSQKLFTRKWRLLNAQEEEKKVLKPLPEVPEAKTSLSVYLWLAVDMSFQTYWQGKQTNKQFTLSRRYKTKLSICRPQKKDTLCIVGR